MFENETVWRLMTPGERETHITSLMRYLYDHTQPGSVARQRIQLLIEQAQARIADPTFQWR